MLLRSRDRLLVRDLARHEYLGVCSLFHNPKQLKSSLKKNVLNEIRTSAIHLTTVKLKNNQRFTGIISSIFLSIAIKLAVKLIEKWIEDHLFESSTLSTTYNYGEPGYVKTK